MKGLLGKGSNRVLGFSFCWDVKVFIGLSCLVCMGEGDLYSQMRRFREDLWGESCCDVCDVQAAAAEAAKRGYVLPAGVRTLPCHEDVNGELVPLCDEGVVGEGE